MTVLRQTVYVDGLVRWPKASVVQVGEELQVLSLNGEGQVAEVARFSGARHTRITSRIKEWQVIAEDGTVTAIRADGGCGCGG